jgi:predicted dehydrogenase
MNTQPTAPGEDARNVNRRRFIAGTGATLGLTLLTPKLAFGAEANTEIRIGLIGCGGRGKWIANLFRKQGGYKLVAVADYFQNRVDSVGEEFQVAAERRFTGLSGYKRLLEQPLDAVVIQSPPYFHPEQAAAAVAAGKHVYLAKPVAVDVPGSQSVAASGTKATQNKLCFLVDYQMPTLPLFQDAVAQIKKGELGTIVSAEASYQTGLVGEAADRARRTDPANAELRLRAWVTDRALSGDVITEQNVHAIDMACRLLDAAPLRAYGTGGKKRDFVGDCWDHFSVIFDFPNQVTTTFSSKQVGFGFDDIMCRVYGTIGMADLHYAGQSLIKSKENGNSVSAPNLYTTGAEANIAAFHEAISKHDFANLTVAPGVRTNLTAILGRTAAYRNRVVTWEEMMRANEPLTANLQGLKA